MALSEQFIRSYENLILKTRIVVCDIVFLSSANKPRVVALNMTPHDNTQLTCSHRGISNSKQAETKKFFEKNLNLSQTFISL